MPSQPDAGNALASILPPIRPMTIALAIVILLGAWWLLLTLWAIGCYRERKRNAQTPLTPEQIKEGKELEERIRPQPMRPLEYVTAGPFIVVWVFLWLPLYLFGWFLKHRDPYNKRETD